MQVKKQQFNLDMEQKTGYKLKKEYGKAVYHHPVYLTYMQNASFEMLGWMKYKLGSKYPGEKKFPGEISITLLMQMTTPLRQKEKN